MDYRLRDCLLYWRIAEADVVAIDMKKWIACGNCFFFWRECYQWQENLVWYIFRIKICRTICVIYRVYSVVTTTHPMIFVNKSSSSSRDNKFFIHYNHERRFRHFKRNLHGIHNRLIVGNRNRPYAANELIHKKPQRWLLTNKAKKIKCKYQRFLGKFKTIYSSSDHILNFNCRST